MGDSSDKPQPEETMAHFFPDVVPLSVNTPHHIKKRTHNTYRSPPQHRPIQTKRSDHPPLRFSTNDFDVAANSESRRHDISRKTLRQLKKGYWPVEAVIDLHGLTRDSAAQTLTCFLDRCLSQAHRCILIIHGKGRNEYAPLKTMTKRGLEMNTHAVLAFCDAPIHLGGTGATIALLRKKQS